MNSRTPWQIQCAVVNALFLREMKTRFGKKKMGYFWAIFESMAYILLLWAMFGAHMRGANKGIDYPMFLMTGMVPYHFFSHVTSGFKSAFTANRGLFNYRQVKPLDTLHARLLLESLVSIIVFIFLLLIGGILGYPAIPQQILPLSFVLILLALFSYGFGLLEAVLGSFSETFPHIMGIAKRPLFFLSGIFFSADSFPDQLQQYFAWNPLLHFLELIRAFFFGVSPWAYASYTYIFLWIIIMNLLGLWLYNRLESKIIAS